MQLFFLQNALKNKHFVAPTLGKAVFENQSKMKFFHVLCAICSHCIMFPWQWVYPFFCFSCFKYRLSILLGIAFFRIFKGLSPSWHMLLFGFILGISLTRLL